MTDQPTLTLVAHSEAPPVHQVQTIARQLGWQPDIIRTPIGEHLPDPLAVRGVVIFGSAASITQRAELEWLQREMRWVEQVLRQRVPVYGICFGCQMLAQIHGGRVYHGEFGREFGFVQVTQCDEDHTFTCDLDGLDVFQAHGDTYSLPGSARRLMTGEVYQEQAARFGTNIYGTQFHPEVSPETVQRWHQFSLEKGRTFGPNVPATPEEHAQLAEAKLKPVHAWLEHFMTGLFGPA